MRLVTGDWSEMDGSNRFGELKNRITGELVAGEEVLMRLTLAPVPIGLERPYPLGIEFAESYDRVPESYREHINSGDSGLRIRLLS